MQTNQTDTTDQAGETDADAWSPTHSGKQDGDSAGSTRAFLGTESASREPARRKLWRSTEKKSSVHSLTTLRSLQRAIPFLSVSLSFIVQWGRPFVTRLHHIYSLSFRTEIPLDFPYRIWLPRTRLSYLPIHYTIKGVPTCKGRFLHATHGLRLGTVFFTTP